MNSSQLRIGLVQAAEAILGKRMTIRLLQRRYIKTYLNAGVVFIHVPKAAGTTIASAIYGKRNGHFSASVIREAMGQEAFQKAYTFGVVRDPVERLRSAHRYAVQGGTDEGGIRNSRLYKRPGMADINRFITDWLVHQDPETIELVFRPQHYFLFENGERLVDEIFRVDDLPVLEEVLSRKLNRDIRFEKRNVSAGQAEINELTQEAREALRHYYIEDYRLLGFISEE